MIYLISEGEFTPLNAGNFEPYRWHLVNGKRWSNSFLRSHASQIQFEYQIYGNRCARTIDAVDDHNSFPSCFHSGMISNYGYFYRIVHHISLITIVQFHLENLTKGQKNDKRNERIVNCQFWVKLLQSKAVYNTFQPMQQVYYTVYFV